MARLPRTGSAVASLWERTPAIDELVKRGLIDPREFVTTLVDALAGLGLAPLSPGDGQKVWDDLAAVIGRGLQEDARLQIADLQTTLRRVARTLNALTAGRRVKSQAIRQIEQTLRARETGLHEAHDIAAANAPPIRGGL